VSIEKFKIEYLIGKNRPSLEIVEAFSFLKTLDDSNKYFEEFISTSPMITAFLVHSDREIVNKYMRDHGINAINSTKEQRIVFLPFLSPEQIISTLAEFSKAEREQIWLREIVSFEEFSTSMISLLEYIRKKYLDGATSENLDAISFPLSDFVSKIPAKNITALFDRATEDESIAELAMEYIKFMPPALITVAIPLMSESMLLKFLNQKSINHHREYFPLMTATQKETYIKNKILNVEPLSIQIKAESDIMESLIEQFQIAPTLELYDQILQRFSKFNQQMQNKLLNYESGTRALNHSLSLYDHEILLSSESKQEVQHQMQRLNDIKGSLKSFVARVNQLERPEVAIPEEFLDPLTYNVMTIPMKDKQGNVCDESTWKQSQGINPFNRQPLIEGSLEVDEDLKKRIAEFKAKKFHRLEDSAKLP